MDVGIFDPDLAMATRQMYLFKPYGHPDTFCPNGALWQLEKARGKWQEWTNKPWQYDFHRAGSWAIERAMLTANGVGKSWDCAFEVACHATGWYPDWWEGHRIDGPCLLWVNARSNDAQREYTQPSLLGENLGEALGTGMIPRHLIAGKPRTRQAGIPDVVDTVMVKRDDGKGVSTIRFKTYEMGWEAQSGGRPRVIWGDEEADDYRVYTEGLTRILRNNGIMLQSLTPMKGETHMTSHFMSEKLKNVYWVGANWDDAPHLTEGMKEHLRASYPDHELEARTLGIPMMGVGRIFTVPEEDILIDPFEIPSHYRRLKSVDFGIDHPAAILEVAYDVDRDIAFIIWDWREKVADAYEHSEGINSRNTWIPVAWPHDGTNREKGSGIQLKQKYQEYGVKMLGRQACWKNDKLGPQPIEPAIEETKDRAASGRLFVFRTCNHFREEYRSFHRDKNGKPAAIHDDVMKAWFYNLMMRRYATTKIDLDPSRFAKAPTAPTVRVR